MKLAVNNHGFEGQLPQNKTGFRVETSAKIFDILSSAIYTDKIAAVIRELSCNAYDAHVAAGKREVPFTVKLPTIIDPTFYVEDQGTGIDPFDYVDPVTGENKNNFVEIYCVYGNSTKTNSNDQIGALGLGSKSPFAYTKSSFVVKNRFNGVEYTNFCFLNESGCPDFSRVNEEPTDRPNGVTVEFAVRNSDIYAFKERAERFFSYWQATRPVFYGYEDELDFSVEKVIEGKDWYLQKSGKPMIMQGNVGYALDSAAFPNLPLHLKMIANSSFVITVQMGEVSFAPSREQLQYDERTCKNVIERLEEVRADLSAAFKDKVFKPGMSQIDFICNFSSTFKSFGNAVNMYGSSTNTAELLLGKKDAADTVNYEGQDYVIFDLISNFVEIKQDGYNSFCIYRSYKNEFSTKLKVSDITFVHCLNKDPKQSYLKGTFSWKPFVKKMSPRDMVDASFVNTVVNNVDSYNIHTINKFMVSAGMTFYVNDVGSSGKVRFKLLNHVNAYFVDFHKSTSLSKVLIDLKALIEKGIGGSKIVLMSTMPDKRPLVDQVEIDKTKVKLSQHTVTFAPTASYKIIYNRFRSTIQAQDCKKHDQETYCFNLSDLQEMDVVPYVLKSRGKKKDEDSESVTSIVYNQNTMTLAAKYVIGDLVVDNSLKVLSLSKGQIAYLTKNKVNLQPLRSLISKRIALLESTEQFYDAVHNKAIISNVSIVRCVYENASEDYSFVLDRLATNCDGSVFKKYFSQYVAAYSIPMDADKIGKTKLYDDLVAHDTARERMDSDYNLVESIDEEINKAYPMLKICNNYYGQNVITVVDYIEQVDYLAKTSI